MACRKAPEEIKIEYPTLEVDLSSNTILAGEDLTIDINQANKLGDANLVLSNGVIAINKFVAAKAHQSITLSSPTTDAAGTFTIRIVKQDSLLFQEDIKILPLALTDPIDIYAGPRTINVDQKQQSMVVAIPRDSFGNPIADGLEVKFSINEEEEDIGSQNKEVEHLVSYKILTADVNADDQFIGISHPSASSKKQKLISIPAWPTQLTLEAEDHFPFANNRNFVKIKTNKLKDQFGNTIPDGTLLRFHIHENGLESARYNGITIDGVAFAYLRNPKQKSDWIIKVSVGDRFFGSGLRLKFDNDLQNLTYEFTDEALIVGPLRGQLGQYISDGTEVILNYKGKKISSETLNGVASFNLENIEWASGSTAILSAAGLQKTIGINE